MKKVLLACCVLLGIGASAQYNYTGDFENPGYNTTTYKQFGGGTQLAAAACNGAFGGQLLTSSTVTQTGYMVDLSTIGQTNNGQKIDISVSYKKQVGVAGTLQLAYFIYDSVTKVWYINLVGSPVSLTSAALTSCTTISATVPVGVVQPGAVAGIGAWFVRSGTANAGVFLDDIRISQDTSVTTAPACTTITSPTDLSTVSSGTSNIKWDVSPTAVNYKVTVGTTPNGSEIYSGTVAGTTINLTLAKSTTYYAKVVPSNLVGDATGCASISFKTDTSVAYCGGIVSSSPTATYPISSVTFNGVTKTSSATVGAPAYEDFTSTVIDITPGNNYDLKVVGTGSGSNVFAMTVFIDWNEDGDFNDADERYFQTAPLVSGSGSPITLNGVVNVPSSVSLGQKRMRIKYNFQGASAIPQAPLADPCSNMTNGQTEDYTISVVARSKPPVCTAISTPVDGSTTFASNGIMTWATALDTSGYKVYIGTTPGGNDIVNGVLVTGTSYQLSLAQYTKYYAKVVPTNEFGDAVGCNEISFTTGAFVYCTAGAVNGSFEKISNVKFAGIDNSSIGTLGYEDFTAITPAVVERSAVYPITVTIGSYDNDTTIVWIDYNQDGVFDDVTEKVTLSVSATATGSITIPASAKFGNTRMRIRMHHAPVGGNATSCGNSSYGQVEDYTITVKEYTAGTSTVNKETRSVYPNPFQEVLNISDIKGVKSISVTDLAGRQVKNMKPAAELNLSTLKSGMYIVTLHMEDGTIQSFKTIKK